MSLDAFTQAFAGTDWDKLAAAGPVAAARGASRLASASVSGSAASSTTATTASSSSSSSRRPVASGLSAGDPPAKTDGSDSPFLTFNDVIDAVNPLQQIPIVDGLYRHFTGDTIRPQGTILGGLLYGGLIGGAIATASVLVQEVTGVDPEEAVIAYFAGDDSTATAAAPTSSSPSPQTAAASSSHQATPSQSSTEAPVSVADANQAALRQLALDLAGGGQAGSGAASSSPSTSSTPTSSPQAASSQVASAGGPGPLVPGVPSNGDSHLSRLTSHGVISNNPNPPPPPSLQLPRRFGGSFQTASTAPSPANGTAAAGAAAVGQPAAGASLPPRTLATPRPARPPAVVLPTGINQGMHLASPAIKPLTDGPSIKPLASPQSPASQPLDPARPITDPPPLPAQPLTPDAVSQVMMRNLDKYQAMARAAAASQKAPPAIVAPAA